MTLRGLTPATAMQGKRTECDFYLDLDLNMSDMTSCSASDFFSDNEVLEGRFWTETHNLDLDSDHDLDLDTDSEMELDTRSSTGSPVTPWCATREDFRVQPTNDLDPDPKPATTSRKRGNKRARRKL